MGMAPGADNGTNPATELTRISRLGGVADCGWRDACHFTFANAP